VTWKKPFKFTPMGDMHFMSKESLRKALISGELTFTTVEGKRVVCKRDDVEMLEYDPTTKNVHRAVVAGQEYKVNYGQLKKIRAFTYHQETS
jgi:hypothetical protein